MLRVDFSRKRNNSPGSIAWKSVRPLGCQKFTSSSPVCTERKSNQSLSVLAIHNLTMGWDYQRQLAAFRRESRAILRASGTLLREHSPSHLRQYAVDSDTSAN